MKLIDGKEFFESLRRREDELITKQAPQWSQNAGLHLQRFAAHDITGICEDIAEDNPLPPGESVKKSSQAFALVFFPQSATDARTSRHGLCALFCRANTYLITLPMKSPCARPSARRSPASWPHEVTWYRQDD